ncbi:hypothetical protein MRB53_038924 [Persea americana]|nr:hypothetical protein MRB53_038924 [Persea americana]
MRNDGEHSPVHAPQQHETASEETKVAPNRLEPVKTETSSDQQLRQRSRFHFPTFGKNKHKEEEQSDGTDVDSNGKKKKKYTFMGQFRAAVLSSWINIILICSPARPLVAFSTRLSVELIVSIIALLKDEIIIVQTSLIGSMLSNLLLVLGMCFFFGGINRVEQFFNVTVAQTAASLLTLSIGTLLIPTVYGRFATPSSTLLVSFIACKN